MEMSFIYRCLFLCLCLCLCIFDSDFVLTSVTFLPAVAGAEVGSSPEAGEGNLHQLVLLHTGAGQLLK